MLAQAAGVRFRPAPSCCSAKPTRTIPSSSEEQMMPFLPIVRVNCVDGAISAALKAEHGYRHTADHPLAESGERDQDGAAS